MALNRLIINGEVKLDISDSTVEENNLLKGVIAYNHLGERIIGIATNGGTSLDDYLKDPVSTDIDHSTNVIKSIMDEGAVTTTFAKEDDSKVIISTITPNTGDTNYIRTTKITKVGQVTEIRETLDEVIKS